MPPPPPESSKLVSPNFAFLAGRSPSLLQAATAAERYVFEDPVTALMRLRQFGELLAQETGGHRGVGHRG